MAEGRDGHIRAAAFLRGPFRLVLSTGEDVTPGSALRQAILAVLLTSPSQTRARHTLQAMFWGSSPAARSSASLRSALYMLRRELAPLGPDALRADRHSVSLAPERITLATTGGPTFLEGMDLPLADCEGFEDWLRQMRGQDDDAHQPAGRGRAPAVQQPTAHVALGLLAPRHAGVAASDLIKAESIVDGIARYVAHITDIHVHDLRGCADFALPLPVDSGLGATHLLQAIVDRNGRKLTIRLRLHEASSRRLVWVSEPLDAPSEVQSEIICSAAEALLQQMAACPAGGDPVDLFPWTALTGLFSLDDALIARTEAKVAEIAADGGPPVFECLRLFAQIFKSNEGIGPAQATSAEQICETLSAMSDAHPMLPLSLSLAGYSAHMLLGDNELAEALVRRADQLAPRLPLNLDHLAVIQLMKGDIDGATAAMQRCQRVGAASPWRYTYDVTGAMISLARGDVRQSLAFANQALIRKPRFIGALRYAMVGFAMSQDARNAQSMKARIRRLRPTYDFEDWTDAVIRRSPRDFADRLARGLQGTGVL